MKKKYVFLLVGFVMFIFMLGFIWNALNHPEETSPFPANVTRVIYWVYLFTTLAMFIISYILFRKEKNKKKYEFLCIAFISFIICLILNWTKYQIEDTKILTSAAKENTYIIIFIIIPAVLLLLFVMMLTMSIVTAVEDKQKNS